MTINLERMTEGYVECAAWADCGPDQETYGHDWSDELLAEVQADCGAFVAACEAIKYVDPGLAEDSLLDCLAEYAPDYSDERFGHDFWLTRNGHGAGYWDRKELSGEIVNKQHGDSLGDALTRVAKAQGSVDLYVGDDGKVYSA